MRNDPYVVTIRGARGTASISGRRIVRYGGHTACLDLAFAPDRRLILDCGSGLRSLAADLPSEPHAAGYQFHVFLTHYHWDHIEGLPCFPPVYDWRSSFSFHGFTHEGFGVQSALEGALQPPWFPVSFADTPSAKTYVDLDGETLFVDGVRVTSAPLRHPQGITGYRLEHAGRSLVFVTDTERGDPECDRALIDLARGADVLVHDAQYTPDEYAARCNGFGHSTWEHAVAVAHEAGVKRLLLFHHDPDRSDDQVDAIVEAAQREFPDVEAAREGMTIPL